MVLGRSLLPPVRSCGPSQTTTSSPSIFISSGVSHGTPPFQKFVVFSVICSPGQWVRSQMVLGRSILPPWRSYGPSSNHHFQPQHFYFKWCKPWDTPFQKFVVFSVICSPGQWVCSQMVFGRRILPPLRSCGPSPSLTFLAPAIYFKWCNPWDPPFQKFVVFSVNCSPGQWICSQRVLG